MDNVITKNMTLENYVKFYNENFYPLNYPYKLKLGIRSNNSDLVLIVQIGIPEDIDEDNFDIDAPTKYNFQDILTIYGKDDIEIINIFNKLEFHQDHKEYFKQLWNKQ